MEEHQPPVPAPGICPICNCPLQGPQLEVVNQAGAKANVHEVCYLRQALAQEQRRSTIWSQLLAALVHAAGDELRVTRQAIQAAAAAGPLVSADQPDGTVKIQVGDGRRIVLAHSLQGLPKPPVRN